MITFLSPVFLWSLIALIPLAAVYFLRVRPRQRSTSAYFLWEKVFAEKRASSLFSRLRDLISLLLMALAFALLALALARPELTRDERKDLLLLVDHSASMSARNGHETRLETARRAARDIAIALDGNQRAAVASIAREIAFLSHLSGSPRELIQAIDTIGPTVFPFSPEALASLARDAQWTENYRIILISDGCFPGAAQIPQNMELFRIGGAAKNLGIVGADLERLPDGRLGFYYRVLSTFDDEVKADLALRHEETGTIARLLPLNLKTGLNPSETVYLEDAADGKWVAELDIEDDFAADNRVFLTVPAPRPVRVGVSAEHRYFFESSVLAFEEGRGALLQLVDKDPEIVIEQGAGRAEAPLSIVFTPSGNSPWWTATGEIADALAPKAVDEDHPVLRHLDLAGISFLGARKITPAPGSLVLVESENGNPLIYRASHEGKTALVVNLDPVESDFYFSAWFPVLVHAAAIHLAGREEELAPVYRSGDYIPIPGRRAGGETILQTADEKPVTIDGEKYGPVSKLGFFDFKNSSGEWIAASALLSSTESNLRGAAPSSSRPVSRGQAPSHWLMALAILILATESILYHRRKAG